MSKILNILLQQSGWFACVLGAAWGRPWTGTVLALVLIGLHLALVRDRGNELRLLLLAGLLGTVLDTVQESLGIVTFPSGHLVPWLCPLWITILWIHFATLLHVTLDWLRGKYLLGGLLGMAGGPVAFWGGARLGAAELHPDLPLALVALAVEWAVAMPLLLWLADRFPVPPSYRGLPGKNALVRKT